VACSGGADSIALLGLLHALADRDGLRLSVGHVDHGLRAASEAEAEGVVAVAETLRLPCRVTRLRLSSGPGLPARARDLRRRALREQAHAEETTVIALGHTATDQAETVLLHLSRGAGLEGLAAMAVYEPFEEVDVGGWLRPLLDLDRGQTRQLSERLGLHFVDDPTNDDRSHPRVRMRHEVLEILRELNPRVEHALARTAMHARQAEDALALWVDRELAERRCEAPQGDMEAIVGSGAVVDPGEAHATTQERGASCVTFASRWSTEGLQWLPGAIRTRFVRRICRAAGSPDDALAARTLASIDEALVHPGPARAWDLHPRLRLRVADGQLWIEPRTERSSRA